MALDREAAARVVADQVARPLGLTLLKAAHAVVAVTAENMVNAIADVTINAGVDPREFAIVAGGGAAGLIMCAIAEELGCTTVVVPEAAATMSAAGAQAADIASTFTIRIGGTPMRPTTRSSYRLSSTAVTSSPSARRLTRQTAATPSRLRTW